MTRGHNSTWNLDPGHNSTWNHDPGHNSTLSYDPGSQFNVELWPRVKISRWIMTRVIVPNCIVIQFKGHNWTLNHVSGSQFNVELRPGVLIQRGIKTRGHNSTGGPNFIRRGVVIQWPHVSGSRNSTRKNRWILITARWNKTLRMEIQWGQNSILHRQQFMSQHMSLVHCDCRKGSRGGRVFKLRGRGSGFDSRSRHLNFRDWACPTFKSRYISNLKTVKAT